tara:strand:+ start:494 stop:598 length:105 start_codon:yes stop_codon:yes gene_type:complete
VGGYGGVYRLGEIGALALDPLLAQRPNMVGQPMV